MNAGHLRKPTKNHVPCETRGCHNYYNVTYRDTNNKCNICRKKEREEGKKNMSRASQFISYINEEKEPDPIDKITKYNDISITKELQKARKKYRKNIKKENKIENNI